MQPSDAGNDHAPSSEAGAPGLVSLATSGDARSCRNCGARTEGHYCANCGQETALALPTFRSFMREAAGRYVALDGRLWRTLSALVARPGMLTREYFAGRRRRYIRPARLFLVLYLLLFAAIGFVRSPADLGDEIVFVQSDDPSVAALTDGTPGPGKDDAKSDTSLRIDKDLNLTMRMGGADVALPEPIRKR